MRAYAVFVSCVLGSGSSPWPTVSSFAFLIVWSCFNHVFGHASAFASWFTSCWPKYVGSWSFRKVLVEFPEEFWAHLKVYY